METSSTRIKEEGGVKTLPQEVLEKLQKLSPEEIERVISSVKKELKCDICEKSFKLPNNLIRHRRSHVSNFECEDCGHITNRKDNLERNRRLKHGKRKRKREEEKRDSGAEKKTRDVPATNGERYDLIHFIKEKKQQITELLLDKNEANNIKYFFNVQVCIIKYLADGTYEEALPHFRIRIKTLLSTRENFEHELNESFQKIFSSMEEFIRNGSGWQLEEVLLLDVTITKYKPLGGGSYMVLPVSLAKSHSLVNVINTDERYLVWSVLASLHYDKERKIRKR
ncbi:unnamed protein product [Mytilus coruscus]|uniref:C2H2-type domain-containing protein n=1 Tax=Mytilus coruscus TaxID=42192 RepID=A0A6J8BM02_MYTCO|nr:unnamed protein product [Mytilus coruscus]